MIINETDLIDLTAILIHKYPNSKWTLNGNDYSGLTWLSDDDKPSKSELESHWLEVSELIEAKKEAKINARISALAKLEALGLTEDDLKALGF